MIHLERQVKAISELDDIDSLVRTHQSRMLPYVTFLIGDQHLAQTITQDCFTPCLTELRWSGSD